MNRNVAAVYRTPDEVFFDPAIRMAVRKPDASFGYLFFDVLPEGRMIGRNGIQHAGRHYRLESLRKHLAYFGERVDVRVNPDDKREVLIFDRGTGAFVCAARADDEDATYSTRDAITQQLLARVFGDGKELLRMARENVAGASERLADYRRAKLAYLEGRAQENRIAREKAQETVNAAAPVAVIGSFSVVARDIESAPERELTAEELIEILDADETTAASALCTVASRPRRKKRGNGRTGHVGALSYEQIADRLGVSLASLKRYRDGIKLWPSDNMRLAYERCVELRRTIPCGEVADDGALPPPLNPDRPRLKRTRILGELSYANCAAAIGMSLSMLERCRSGKRSWPEGKRELFEAWERDRHAAQGSTRM